MENLAGVEIPEETRKGGLGTGQGDEVGIVTDLVYEAASIQPRDDRESEGCHSRVSWLNLVWETSLYIQGSEGLTGHTGLETTVQLGR